MDITSLFMFCLISLVIGAVLMLIAQYYVFVRYCDLPEATNEQKDINEKYSLPEGIQINANNVDNSLDANQSPLVAINFVMQFLFHELKNSNRVRKWFYRKLSLELDELIAKTTTGKLFDKLTIKELELGDQFPEIKNLRVHNAEIHDTEGRIENLDLLLEIQYQGNFRTSIDADMVLGKKGSLTLKVKKLSGLARLQFTRKPYTHWSLSFLGDPELDLGIESKYQGRQMQSNITSLISNQIRKAVRRKHTLPNYKLRYKPFFHKTPDEDFGDGEIQPNGTLVVKVSELSRLMYPINVTDIYCTLTMSSMAWVEARQKDDRNVLVSLDMEIHKAKNQQIGIVFKQAEHFVEIEAVLPNTPACKSNLKTGDILVAIEGKRVTTIQQVAKLVKGLHNSVFSLRIERVVPGIIRNDAILEDLELYEDLSDPKSSYTKPTEADLLAKLAKYNFNEKAASSSESSIANTPTNSPKKSKLIAKALKKTIIRENSSTSIGDESKSKAKFDEKEEKSTGVVVVRSTGESVSDVEHYYQHSTVDCSVDRLIHMEDLSQFKLNPKCKYLNVCVYGKRTGDSAFLGFINIPIAAVLADCSETSLTQSIKSFELMPPIVQDLKSHYLSTQSGFDENLCYGDILFAFTWDGNPAMQVTSSETPAKQVNKFKTKCSFDKLDDGVISENFKSSDNTVNISSSPSTIRAHNFIRTHFHRATQCDFCGKKIWLKDAVQCRECSMCCHKKCVTKCQNSTVCGPVDCTTALVQGPLAATTAIVSPVTTTAPEFTVTEAANSNAAEKDPESLENDNDALGKLPPTITTAGLEVHHHQSLTGLLAQSLKRVNSANNLVIPGIVSSFGGSVGSAASGIHNSKSLPPSPQHSPRKQSLINQEVNPFEEVTQKLESISDHLAELSKEQISTITQPIINMSGDVDIMTLAKTASKELYPELDALERVEKINLLLSKLRLALDSETAIHSTLLSSNNDIDNSSSVPQQTIKIESGVAEISGKSEESSTSNHHCKASVLCQSEERVQALSVIMLYLCTGLQHAQGVACQ